MAELDPRYRRLIPGTRDFADAQRLDIRMLDPRAAYPSWNQQAWNAAVEGWPMSQNIEDRRGQVYALPQQASLWDLRRFLPFMGR